MHAASFRSEPVPLREWEPICPAGDLRSIVLHWTAGDYTTVFPAYHFCIAGAREPVVHATFDLRANMRDVSRDPLAPYAAHTYRRNSYAIGIAICAMRAATPSDFGAFAVTDVQVDALCRVAARLAHRYAIPLANIRTHAEHAVTDGYFGLRDDERWDGARFAPSNIELMDAEVAQTGNELRARMSAAGIDCA